MKKTKIPRYNSILFIILPFVIYLALNFSFVGTMFIKEIVEYGSAILPNIKVIQSYDMEDLELILENNIRNRDITPEERIKRVYLRDIFGSFIVMGVLIFLFNLPIKLFFIKKRRSKKINHFIKSYTRSLINFSPEIITLIVLLGSVYIHRSIFTLLNNTDKGQAMYLVVRNILTISIFTSFLVLLLIYFGQKFRVQTKYVHHVFTPKRLYKLPRGFNFPGLKGRFFITTIFLTFIPLVIVLFYVLSSFNTLENLDGLTRDQIDFLFGDLLEFMSIVSDETSEIALNKLMEGREINYIDAFGVLQLYMGIIPGLFFSLIYIFKIVSWSNASILKPIKELLVSMKKVAKGNLNSYAIVRSREETGQLASGFNQMLNGLKDRERIKTLFGQYLSAEVSEEILKGNVDLNGSMYKATILFADIRGFTTLSESISPPETISFLNEYYNVLIEVVYQYGGIIDKFMGDGILVLFGVPIASQDHADRAVAAAFAMQQKLKEFNKNRRDRELFTVNVGIGIHTGEVIAGNVGNSDKLEYTVIGDTVNVASRIENLTKKFDSQILIGESVYNSLSKDNTSRQKFEKLEGVALRGKRVKVNLLKLISPVEGHPTL